MAKKIFISFSSLDNKKMITLKRSIEDKIGDGCEVIIISDRKSPTTPLAEKVKGGLNESHFFIPILTNNSIDNQWVNQEIGFSMALEQNAKITCLPIVDKNILDSLKGFIHKQLDIPFTFISTSPSTFKKCCEKLSQYLYDLIPQTYSTSRNKVVNTAKLGDLMSKIYKKYGIDYTELLNPRINDDYTRVHSHGDKGYFAYLLHESCKVYSFKYFDPKDKNNRFITIHVNNTKPNLKIESHLTPKENTEIKSEFISILNGSEVKNIKIEEGFLQQKISENSLLDYANIKYKNFKQNDYDMNKLLWGDLNKNKYKTLEDIEQIVKKAKPAVDAYYRDNPFVYISGTDFLTKSLGFVDLDFRKKHPFGIETMNAFGKYSYLIK